jgi:REP element-mobilizing transposase RayT
VFADVECVALALLHFRQAATHEQFDILAYCLMPDHAHLLVEGRADTADLRRFAKLAKQASGAAYALRAGRPLWQEGYFDRVLRDDDEGRSTMRYMLDNPVRAGIVREPADYRHTGSDRWTMQQLLEGCW